MKTIDSSLLHALALIALSLPACAVSPGAEGRLGAAAEAAEAENGLSMNGLSMNGLSMNGLTMNGLSQTSSIAATLDTDALARQFFSYVVSCALPADQSLVFPTLAGQTDYTFAGGLGVAPDWGADGASCDLTCQRWVSACVISRVNYLGEHVPLSLRGDNPALAVSDDERADYPNREATYFGDVLVYPQQLYACRTAGDDQTLIGRPCGDGADVSGCLIDVLGDCTTACGVHDPTDGYHGDCTTPDDGSFVPAVTVYRQ